MPVDFDRYNALIARAAFNMEAWRGTIQDQSRNQQAMQFSGSPTWARSNGYPIIHSPGANQYPATVNAIAGIVDVTGTFFVEWLAVARQGLSYYRPIMQYDGAGGMASGIYSPNWYVGLQLFRPGGVWAVELYTASGLVPQHRMIHVVFESTNGAASGKCWVNNGPRALTRAFAGAGTNAAAAIIRCGHTDSSSYGDILISRVWSGTADAEDVSALYEQAKLLVGGEI